MSETLGDRLDNLMLFLNELFLQTTKNPKEVSDQASHHITTMELLKRNPLVEWGRETEAKLNAEDEAGASL